MMGGCGVVTLRGTSSVWGTANLPNGLAVKPRELGGESGQPPLIKIRRVL